MGFAEHRIRYECGMTAVWQFISLFVGIQLGRMALPSWQWHFCNFNLQIAQWMTPEWSKKAHTIPVFTDQDGNFGFKINKCKCKCIYGLVCLFVSLFICSCASVLLLLLLLLFLLHFFQFLFFSSQKTFSLNLRRAHYSFGLFVTLNKMENIFQGKIKRKSLCH